MIFNKKIKNSKCENWDLKHKLENLKCRKICFVDNNFKETCDDIETNPTNILKLNPVNYYQSKESYILVKVYTSQDFTENYIQLLHYRNEKLEGTSKILNIDTQLVVKLLSKVGIIINI